jgi:hypothetical protein
MEDKCAITIKTRTHPRWVVDIDEEKGCPARKEKNEFILLL